MYRKKNSSDRFIDKQNKFSGDKFQKNYQIQMASKSHFMTIKCNIIIENTAFSFDKPNHLNLSLAILVFSCIIGYNNNHYEVSC